MSTSSGLTGHEEGYQLHRLLMLLGSHFLFISMTKLFTKAMVPLSVSTKDYDQH